MTSHLTRRTLLGAAGATALLPWAASAQERRFEPQVGAWRAFETTTTISVADAAGGCRVWLPLPDVETEWQRSLDHSWTGNAATAKIVSDPARGVRMFYADFAPTTSAPTVTVVSRIQTRNRAVDWSKRDAPAEDPAVLRAALQPSELMPLDGIVRKTALDATRGASIDVDKARLELGVAQQNLESRKSVRDLFSDAENRRAEDEADRRSLDYEAARQKLELLRERLGLQGLPLPTRRSSHRPDRG